MTKRGIRILNSVIDYVYCEGQDARTKDDKDAVSLTLALLGHVRRGETSPFALACYSVYGMPAEQYQERRSEERWRQHSELMRCIPDYDPNLEPASRLPGPTGREGFMSEMSTEKGSQPDALSRVPRASEKTQSRASEEVA